MKKKLSLLLALGLVMAACQSEDLSQTGPAQKTRASKTLKTRSEQPGTNFTDVRFTLVAIPSDLLDREPNGYYDIRDMAISPDGQHIALATTGFNNPISFQMLKFNQSTRTFTRMNDIIANNSSSWFESASYSPDGKLLLMGHGYNKYGISLFERNGDNYTQITLPGPQTLGALTCSFSKKGNFIIGCGNENGLDSDIILQRTGAKSFAPVAQDLVPGQSDYCFITPDEKYFVFKKSLYSNLHFIKYNKDDNTFERINTPASLDKVLIENCSFSSDGKYMATGGSRKPCLNMFKIENGEFTQIEIVGVSENYHVPVPTSVVETVFSPDDKLLLVLDNGDRLWIYKRNGDRYEYHTYWALGKDSGFETVAGAKYLRFSPDGKTLFMAPIVDAPFAAFKVEYLNYSRIGQ